MINFAKIEYDKLHRILNMPEEESIKIYKMSHATALRRLNELVHDLLVEGEKKIKEKSK